MPQKVIVFEINEVPLRIFRHFQALKPGSHIDTLLKQSQVIETLALDVERAQLYPSQTWASLNTGAPYSSHRIHWYGDPKPDQYPLYWKQLAAKGFSVGLVNTLHSSPAEEFAGRNDNFKFVIPDCFAIDSYTKPGYFEPFQSLNLKAVSANSRAATMRAPVQEAALTVLNAPRYGIRMKTMWSGLSLMTKILSRKVNRERLRNMQFPLVADIFMDLFRKHQPDLAVIFTNHVAANMHRYWYGLFPKDYQQTIYEDGWIEKYHGEIMAAVDLLDTYMGELMNLARQSGRMLVVVSSMGQQANQNLTPEYRKARAYGFRLEDVKRFVDKLTAQPHSFKIEQAMVPQYSLAFANESAAQRAAQEIRDAMPGIRGITMACDQNTNVITLTITVDPTAPELVLRGRAFQYAELGFARFEIDDHHSGCHCPEGSLLIYNSQTARVGPASVNYLEYTPALLKHFGLEPPSYMAEPSFSF